jgi:FtsH-binding integral membrane protein
MTVNCSWGSRLRQPVFVWGAAALATQLAVDWLFDYRHPRSLAWSCFAFLPALMWILVIVGFVRAFLTSDELQQRIHLQAASIAFVLTVILTLIFAGLARAGIYQGTWNDLGSPLMFLLLVAYVFSAWRYR